MTAGPTCSDRDVISAVVCGGTAGHSSRLRPSAHSRPCLECHSMVTLSRTLCLSQWLSHDSPSRSAPRRPSNRDGATALPTSRVASRRVAPHARALEQHSSANPLPPVPVPVPKAPARHGTAIESATAKDALLLVIARLSIRITSAITLTGRMLSTRVLRLTNCSYQQRSLPE